MEFQTQFARDMYEHRHKGTALNVPGITGSTINVEDLPAEVRERYGMDSGTVDVWLEPMDGAHFEVRAEW